MKIINPISVTQDKIIGYNVGQYLPIWNGVIPYAKGNRIILNGFGDTVYESLTDNNINTYPPTNPALWLVVGVSNYAAMFDGVNNNKTSNPDTINITIKTNELVNAIGLINLSSNSVSATMMLASGQVVFNQTTTTKTLPCYDWYSFIFGEFTQETTAIFDNLPPYRDAYITVSIENTGALAQVGTLVFGKIETIGESEYGFSSTFIDYSTKTTNEFGDTTLVKRYSAKSLEATVSVDTSKLTMLETLRAAISTTPVICIGHKSHAITIGFGFFERFDLNLTNAIKSQASIRILTLT